MWYDRFALLLFFSHSKQSIMRTLIMLFLLGGTFSFCLGNTTPSKNGGKTTMPSEVELAPCQGGSTTTATFYGRATRIHHDLIFNKIDIDCDPDDRVCYKVEITTCPEKADYWKVIDDSFSLISEGELVSYSTSQNGSVTTHHIDLD